jgi:hypothetical protein
MGHAFTNREARGSMLRIMITDTAFGQKWVLQGKLCGKWAENLRE